MENDFEKSLDVLEAENENKELEKQLEFFKEQNESLTKKIDAIVTCPICEEKFESTGERIPSKLKCSHIVCHQCAQGWLKTKAGFQINSSSSLSDWRLSWPMIHGPMRYQYKFETTSKGTKASCPQCRTLYRAADIRPINFNYEI